MFEENIKLLNEFFRKNGELSALRKQFLKETKLEKQENIVATGHQPNFYYPGISLKNYLVYRLAKKLNKFPVNFVVDTDTAKLDVKIPCLINKNYKTKKINIKNENTVCYSHFNPAIKKVDKYLEKIKKTVESLKEEEIEISFLSFKKEFREIFDKRKNFIEAIIETRNNFEKRCGFPVSDFRISKLTKTESFFQFFTYITKDIERFASVYNNGISLHSKKYKLARPLKQNNGAFELPFWYIDSIGRRKELIIEFKNNNSRVLTDNGNTFLFDIDLENDKLTEKKILIYPKAVILTLIVRLFLSVVFVHGKGGSVYDNITNYLMKHYFGLKNSPEYLTVTGEITLPLSQDIEKYENEKREILNWLSTMKRKPELLLDPEGSTKYKKKKIEISGQIKIEKDPEIRKRLHNSIKNLNIEILNLLKSKKLEKMKRLSDIEKVLKFKEVFKEREYPYFIYPEEYLSHKLKQQIDSYKW